MDAFLVGKAHCGMEQTVELFQNKIYSWGEAWTYPVFGKGVLPFVNSVSLHGLLFIFFAKSNLHLKLMNFVLSERITLKNMWNRLNLSCLKGV
jgi:hypothetical protein